MVPHVHHDPLTGEAPSYSPAASPRVRRRLPRGLLHLAYTGYGVARTLIRTCTAVRPISTRLESVPNLRGFHHWFLHSYTFPSCLTNPDRLAVPARPAVVGAAPTFPCDSRIGLLPASAAAATAHRRVPFILAGSDAPRGARTRSSGLGCSY